MPQSTMLADANDFAGKLLGSESQRGQEHHKHSHGREGMSLHERLLA
jgi:hypothetical protein